MRRTSAGVLTVFALLAAGAGFLADHLATVTGSATFTPSFMLPVLLLLIGAISLGLAWQVRQSVRTGRRIDPLVAVRAATLARASSRLAAAVGGCGVGLLAFLLTRPVGPPIGSTVAILAMIACSVVLVICALVAEQFCTLPKDPDDRQPDAPAQ